MKKPKKKESAIGRPMCKICEARHWSHEPHQFKPTKEDKPKRDRDD